LTNKDGTYASRRSIIGALLAGPVDWFRVFTAD